MFYVPISIHRQVLMFETLPDITNNVLKSCVSIINFIGSRSLNSRLFKIFCIDTDECFLQLLLHTEVRWLSLGKMLNRFLKWSRYTRIFNNLNSPLAEVFKVKSFIPILSYLLDIFHHINTLNLLLQGRNLIWYVLLIF